VNTPLAPALKRAAWVSRLLERWRAIDSSASAGWPAANFLGHLRVRDHSPATVRAYAFDIANLATFLMARFEYGRLVELSVLWTNPVILRHLRQLSAVSRDERANAALPG